MPAFVVGDVHGCREVLVGLLHDAGLIDAAGRWSGADARLWLTGDLVDRGPDGVGTIDLVSSLERQGDVRCLLGNHEVLLLGAERHGDAVVAGTDVTFLELWLLNGGHPGDLGRLDASQLAWLRARPLVGREGPWLLLHADTDRYLELGDAAATIHSNAFAVLERGSADEHALVLDVLSDRGALASRDGVDRMLRVFGGDRIVHGHTPIALVLGVDPHEVTGPLRSPDGRVVNVDHCLFAGGPGFVVELDG